MVAINEFYLMPNISSSIIEELLDEMIIANTISRASPADFGGGRGISLTFRVPALLGARERNLYSDENFIRDTIKESSITVKLDRELYNRLQLTDTELYYNLEDWTRQIVKSHINGLRESIESYVIRNLKANMPHAGEEHGIYWNEKNPVTTFYKLHRVLKETGIPLQNNVAILSPDLVEDLSNNPLLLEANKAGDNQLLRKGTLGTIAGHTIIESSRIEEGTGLFYNRDSFVLACQANGVEDIPFSSTMSQDGFSLRFFKSFNPDNAVHTSHLDTMVGFYAIPVIQFKTVYEPGKNKDGIYKPIFDENGLPVKVVPALKITRDPNPKKGNGDSIKVNKPLVGNNKK